MWKIRNSILLLLQVLLFGLWNDENEIKYFAKEK